MKRYPIELTPEETYRIYVEEKVRLQARKRIQREQTKRRAFWIFGLGFLAVFLGSMFVPDRGSILTRSRTPKDGDGARPLHQESEVSAAYGRNNAV